MSKHYDVIVVGAGSMGMAAGYFLAKQGKSTLLIDAYDPPHTMGSHHGDTRIIRHAYGEGAQYVPLVLRAQQLWNELEQESGESLFQQTGVLCAEEPGCTFVRGVIASAQQYSLPIEVLDAEEIRYRWKGITVPDGFTGCFEQSSGVLFSETCLSAYRKLAVQYGAELLPYTSVQQIELHPAGATVRANEAAYHADALVLSAGAWMKQMLDSLDLELALQPTRKAVAWFEADEALYNPEVFPAFSFNLQGEDYYGFPSFAGTGLKIGRHDGGQQTDPNQVNREFGAYPEDEGDVRSFLQRYMPQAAGRLKQGKICLYTLTPDRDFIIDRHPLYPHVVLTAGFSGHGFKFASAVGEIASQLITAGETPLDISMFSVGRFATSRP
ncbi:N-methyl-L-tryptophan oxidase [Brevibacillus sp. B_LB10_24]|uniref:N-methyl-L-tryptophan oxidase n=1 Tax=Brevibacillus sp. B_LB10_24 TaxID=3380645 RepID=UPI0038B73916